MSKGIKRQLRAALKHANAEISNHARSGGRFSAGLASEGYAGGYADALRDVELVLIGVPPTSSRGSLYWRDMPGIISMSTEKHPAPVLSWFDYVKATDGEIVAAFSDSCMGVHCTTPAFTLKRADGKIVARVGFAVMGSPNMSEAQFAACQHNPFHPDFHDNFTEAVADTVQEALKGLGDDLKRISDDLWADF